MKITIHDPEDTPPQEVLNHLGQVIFTYPQMCTMDCLLKAWGLQERVKNDPVYGRGWTLQGGR